MSRNRRTTTALLALLCCAATGIGCDDRRPLCSSCDAGRVDAGVTHTQFFPQGGPRNELDVLFVIDNSSSMAEAQQRLIASFPQMLESLRHPGSKALPNLHIGVVSTDLGAGDYALPSCELKGGNGGKLLRGSDAPGCPNAGDPWLAHSDGVTNLPGCTGDGAACLRDAFGCFAALGTSGCGFEAPLEAARRALDPKLNVNPGFHRTDATLMIVFVSDEDDCSARNPAIFDPQQQGLSDPLGPLTPFRCFEFGVQCDIIDRNVAGPRKGCIPAFDWLTKVQEYIGFFRDLAPQGRVLLSAIVGPKEPVVVGKDGVNPMLEPSCKVSLGGSELSAVPALRIAAVVEGLQGTLLPFCAATGYGLALSEYGKRVSTAPNFQCLGQPPLLPDGAIACHAGVPPCRMPTCDASRGERCDELSGFCIAAQKLTSKPCGATCLDRVDCQVAERSSPASAYQSVPRCERMQFLQPDLPADACGANCPCWRLVPRPEVCSAAVGVTPFALQIMRKQPAEPGSLARLTCHVATEAWSSPAVQQAPQHCSLP